MKAISEGAILLVVWGLLTSVCCANGADTLSLLPPQHHWTANIDRGGTKMELAPTAEAPLAVTITCDGGEEDYPKLRVQFAEPQDWTKYTRLRMRVRVSTEDQTVRARRMAIVVYDDKYRHEELEGHPMWQQVLHHYLPVGRWTETRDWIVDLKRTAVRQVDLYLYEDVPPNAPMRWEFATLQLEGIGEQTIAFDTEFYGKKEWPAPKRGPAVAHLKSKAGFGLSLDADGCVVALTGVSWPRNWQGPSGLLVRDVTQEAPPQPFGGTVVKLPDGWRQQAQSAKLGLALEATYRAIGERLEISGIVRDTTGRDRAITLYFALPVGPGPWRWWDSSSQFRWPSREGSELAYLETGMQYGLNGQHSKYPLGAITAAQVGLTLGVRMDEPVVHRIGYSPSAGLFYIACDFGLVPEKTIKGRSLAEAPFRFLLYPHDPRWGFRSALQRYYDFFPEFFVNRVPGAKQGGWFVWGDMRKYEGDALAAGFRMHWGPGGVEAIKWDNEHSVYALLYIEAEFYQQTMGDYTTQPPLSIAIERLRKVAAGDEEELAKYEKLGYAHGYVPGKWVREHSLREALRTVSEAAWRSVNYEADGQPTGMPGKFPWMSESQLGVIFPCNLDPDIPQGKGWFGRHVYIESGLMEMQDAGAHYDGIALDSLGGYGQLSRANYRREHFRYVDTPLTFSASDHVPVIAMFTSTVEWLRELAADMHKRGLILMANCSWGMTPGWLTFAAPYLDVFGAEAPTFADPDFIRAIARQRLCTDLPYKPVPDWQLQRNLLHGIFPGHGNKPDYMAQFAAQFRQLAEAGWEPITRAEVTPEIVRVERFGRNIFVLHNPTEEPVEARLRVSDLGPKGKQPVQPLERVVPLAAKGTAVVRLE